MLIPASILLQQSSVKNVFIRGSVVRYVHLPANAVDTPLLEDATRRGTKAISGRHEEEFEGTWLTTALQKLHRLRQRPSRAPHRDLNNDGQYYLPPPGESAKL